MLKTVLWVFVFITCICWVIGAYNRLVRLRSAASNKDADELAIYKYNSAIKQFPASWLAAVFAFKPCIHSRENTI